MPYIHYRQLFITIVNGASCYLVFLLTALLIQAFLHIQTLGAQIAIIYPIAMPVSLSCLFLLTRIQHKNMFTAYFIWHIPTIKETCYCVLITIIMFILIHYAESALSVPPSLQLWMKHLLTANPLLPLLLLVVIVVAPFFEEVLFRGYLFYGFTQAGLPVWLTAFISSVCWSLLHTQYQDWRLLGLVGLLGMVLAYVRFYTGSLLMPLMIHLLFNGLQIASYFYGNDVS